MEQVKILVVEDEPIVALELKETLEKLGYQIPAVIDSADAVLDAVLKHAPALILMDIRLRSFIDGIDAAKRLQLLRPVPVIFLTAQTSSDIRLRAERSGPAAYLTKPVSERVLAEAIDKALSIGQSA